MPHHRPPLRPAWRSTVASRLTPTQRVWLFRPGALTAGLRALGSFRLRVSREYVARLDAPEARILRQSVGTVVWVREVVMSVGGVDCVSARSMTPLIASHGTWSAMRRLKTRPLADILYDAREVTRGPFMWRQIGVGDSLWLAVRRNSDQARQDGAGPDRDSETAHGAHGRAPQPAGEHARWVSRPQLYARQSVFWRGAMPLLVQECFLPDFWRQLDRVGSARPTPSD